MNVQTNEIPRSLLARQRLALDMIDRGAPLAETLTLLCHIVEAEAQSLVRAWRPQPVSGPSILIRPVKTGTH